MTPMCSRPSCQAQVKGFGIPRSEPVNAQPVPAERVLRPFVEHAARLGAGERRDGRSRRSGDGAELVELRRGPQAGNVQSHAAIEDVVAGRLDELETIRAGEKESLPL